MAKITLYGNLFPFRNYFIKFKGKRYPKARKTVVLQLDAASNEKMCAVKHTMVKVLSGTILTKSFR